MHAFAQKREPESDLEKSRVFDNQEDAAKEALSQNLEVSKEINKEIGGMVYKRPDGTYGYTCCYVGVRDTVDPGGPESVPLNTKGTAYWHTHGDHSAIYEVETFSDQDFRYADHYRIDAYLMTPNGNLLHYESGR